MKKNLLLIFVVSIASIVASAAYEVETQEIKDKMANLVVHKSVKYCVANTLTCRDMVLLKDKVTGIVTDEIMYDNFVSSERAVASTGWFLKNEDGTYRARIDKVFDGQIAVDFIEPANSNITITFDAEGYPTFHDVTLKRLGTTRKILSTMSYSSSQSHIVGVETDDADPNFSQPVNTVYIKLNQ